MNKVLIAAAGSGSRANLAYPKTLHIIDNKPMIIHIIENTNHIDQHPTVIVSPSGHDLVKDTLQRYKKKFELVIQEHPIGMGNAVLSFKHSRFYDATKKILLLWGDVPFIKKDTIDQTIQAFNKNKACFAFPTGISKNPYTLVERDDLNNINGIVELKGTQKYLNKMGERDIGCFYFEKATVFEILSHEERMESYSLEKEHSFLSIVGALSVNNKVIGLQIANNEEMLQFNTAEELSRD